MQKYLVEVSALKVRIKFTKTGSLKFIGHLDVMRYFQKAFRRAEVDVAYSKGFSPHQLLSFAAPLGIGLTSEGEYLDAEFESVLTSKEMLEKINEVMVEELHILEFKELDDNAENAMASVAGADYLVKIRDGYYKDHTFFEQLDSFAKKDSICILKKTKKSEKEVDIRPMIYKIEQKDDAIFMQLATGSVANLKPETVMMALCKECGMEYEPFGFLVHRLETYMQDPKEEGKLIPLGAVGHEIMEPKQDGKKEA